MKKILSVLIIVLLLAGVCSAGADGDITMFAPGRLSVPVPSGWGAFLADAADDTSVTLVKGGSSMMDLIFNPAISVMYTPLGTLVLDSRDIQESSEDIEPFSLGGYDWTGYSYSSYGLSGIRINTEGNFGTITVSISPRGMAGGDETISLEDADVQAILSGITVQVAVEADWAVINGDGTLTVRLPGREGCEWKQGMSSSIDLSGGENNPSCEIAEAAEDGVYTATLRVEGSGAYSQGFSLSDDEEQVADALVTVLCEDGIITCLTDAKINGIQ